MGLNSSGQISLAGNVIGESIEIELGGTGSTQISLNDSAVRTLANVPSGQITMPTNFWGASNLSASYSSFAPDLTTVVNNGSVWLAAITASSNTIAVYRSTDGATWTALDMTIFNMGIPLSTTYPLGGLYYVNNLFVIVTNAGSVGYTYTSSDGLTWTLIASGSGTTALLANPINILWNGTNYLAIYSSSFRYSSNLSTWTNYSFSGTTYSAIYDGTYFIVGGTYGISVSTTGTSAASFTNVLSITTGATAYRCRFIGYSGGSYITTNSQTVYTSSNLLSWSSVGSLPTSNYGYSVAWDVATNNWNIAGSDTSTTINTAKILRSTNGVSWSTIVSNQDYVSLNSISYMPTGQLVAVGNNATVLYSSNGTSYTNNFGNYVNCDPKCSFYANSTYFIGGSYISSGTRYKCIYSSSDAITWTLVASFTASSVNDYVCGITANGTNYVALCSLGTTLTSSNGTTWTQNSGALPSTSPSGSTANYTSITYGSNTGYYVAVGWYSDVYSSTNGTSWTYRGSSPYSYNWVQVRYLNNYYFAVDTTNSYGISADGISWTRTSTTSIFGSYGNCMYDGANYVLWGNSGSPALVYQNGAFVSNAWSQNNTWSIAQAANYGNSKFFSSYYGKVYYANSLSSAQSSVSLPRKGSFNDVSTAGPKVVYVGSPKMIVVVQ